MANEIAKLQNGNPGILHGGGAMAPVITAPADAQYGSSYSQRRALMPVDYQEAFQMAGAMARSGLFAAKNPEQAVVILMTGMELGLAPAQAMRGIYVVQNRPVLSADMMVAICKSARDVCHYFRLVETNEDHATYETHRVGDPEATRLSFTAADAQSAGLLNKDTWKQYRPQMLRARCSSALARAVYPDLLLGLYTPEEVEGLPTPPPRAPNPGGDYRPLPNSMREARAMVQGEPEPESDAQAERKQLAREIGEARKRAFGDDTDRYKAWLVKFHQSDSIRPLETGALAQVLSDLNHLIADGEEVAETDPFEEGQTALLDVEPGADDVPSGIKG